MNEAEQPTPETSTPDAGSTRDVALGRLTLWSAVGIGVIAAFKLIDKAALSYARQAHLERVAPRRSGSPPMGCTAPAGPPRQGLYGPGPLHVHESGAELKRYWKMDDAVRDRR